MSMLRILVVLLALGANACVPGLWSRTPRSDAAVGRVPVLLATEGDAVDPATVAEVAALLSAHIGRPVVTAVEAGLDEAGLRALLAEQYGRLPSGGWAATPCAAGRAAAHALRYESDAYYHLRLDRTETTRAATARERAEVSGPRHASATILKGLGLASPGTVREAQLTGALTVTTFGRTPETVRRPLRATAYEVDPIGGIRLDAPGVVAAVIDRLAPPPWPHWDGMARSQLRAGCRVAALAIYHARLRERAGSRDVLAFALGRGTARAAQRPVVAAPSVPPPTPGAAPAPDPRHTCRALCELHMVELCNNDRDLWSRHQQFWESTPCGQRRAEPFLLDCYQRQWLSGTFDEACVVPCKRATDGRARLMHMLQGGGCTRTSSL
jgi:hypothetical protein